MTYQQWLFLVSLSIILTSSLFGQTSAQAGLFIMPAQVNGSTPLNFVVDSGASHCIIDRNAAQHLGLKLEGEGQVKGTGTGPVAMQHIRSATILAAGIALAVPDLWVVDMSPTPGSPQGLLGYEFFENSIVQLDGPSHQIHILKSLRGVRSSKTTAIPLVLHDREMFIEIHLGANDSGDISRKVRVDTGSTDFIIDDEVLNAPDRHTVVLGKGIGKDFVGTAGTISHLSIGPLRFTNLPGAAGKPRIGMGIIGQFVATFDLSNQVLYLSKP